MGQLRRSGVLLTGLAVLALTVGACGGGGGDDGVATLGGASGSSDRDSGENADLEPEEAAHKFAECMREHGIDMPDPEIGEDGGFAIQLPDPKGGPARDPEKVEEAHKACEHFLQDALPESERPDPEQDARHREQALALAQCMRDEGFDWPDPTFDDGGRVTQILGPDQGIDPSDPKVQAALERCAEKFGLPMPEKGDSVRGGRAEKAR